jgi:urea transport system permease protein
MQPVFQHRTLRALLENRLHYRSSDKLIAAAKGEGSSVSFVDVKSGEDIEDAQPADFARVTTNNQLRRSLRSSLAVLELGNDDASVRLAAVRELMRTMDEDAAVLLRPRLDT